MAAFAQLLPIAPQLLSHAVSAFTYSPSFFEVICRNASEQRSNEDDVRRLKRFARSTFRLVRFSVATFASMWNWSPFYSLLLYPDREVRSYAAYTLSLVMGMSDAERRTFLEKYAGRDGPHPSILRLQEDEKDAVEQAHLFNNDLGTNSQPGAASLIVSRIDLCPLTVDLCGVLLPVATESMQSNRVSDTGRHLLVLTNTTRRNLHDVAEALSVGMPIMLEGPPGVGKTSVVEEAAMLTGCKDLLKIHLGDQTDSKVLLGTYVCTATPGVFRWQPGVLATAVAEGRWILIEDFDLAPLEVISVLLPLLETRHLFIPSRGEKIKAKEGFRIFATRTMFPTRGGFAHRPGGHQAGQNLWTKIRVQALPPQEVGEVLSSLYPALQGLLLEILSAFETTAQHFEEHPGVGRHLSLRDLVKWCSRVDSMRNKLSSNTEGESLELAVREDLFREAAECFAGMIPKRDVREQIGERLGTTLGVPVHRVQFYTETYVPNLQIGEGVVSVGRSSLAMSERVTGRGVAKRPFAATGPSLRLLERLAVCANLCEPVLLVGETGTGKTSVVQYLADLVGQKLVAVNMSQQSDSSDLLGGYKPVDARLLATPIKEEFDRLFAATFKVKANTTFLDMVQKAYVKKNWARLVEGFRAALKMAQEVVERQKPYADAAREEATTGGKRKRMKRALGPELVSDWARFSNAVDQFEAQHEQIKSNFLFSFVEGTLVKAIKNGHWVLLDEINLATAETLECLSGLLQGADGSLLLMERGDTAPVERHPDFRLFACMNPANDVGKRDLPPGLRSRFTEFWVDAPDSNRSDLLLIVRRYLQDHLPPSTQGEQVCADVADFYVAARDAAHEGVIFDGADQRVHVSMRTLTRALSYAVQIAPTYGLRRSIFEGICMTFMTGLNRQSMQKMDQILGQSLRKGFSTKHVPRNPSAPSDTTSYDAAGADPECRHVLVDCFWLERGSLDIPLDLEDTYVLTPSVEGNLSNLARAVMSRRYPVLIQGPTSAGKTSMVEYLAKRTGHRFVRINNHEHTDLQEYLGSYVSDEKGTLVFQEGVLVEALRKGYWIVLDELNLAPSDVLEALNRLLDDNRELLIPETQEVVRPHPHFMLFATQNPAGQYGGRKQLSRAFRNRFLELHFSDIPEEELETILGQRCKIPLSYAKKLVAVYRALQEVRGRSRIFDGRHGFVTLRDLFRWAMRGANGYQKLAEDGYLILAERIRREDDKLTVKEAIEKVMKVKIDEVAMYDEEFSLAMARIKDLPESEHVAKLVDDVVWTKAMKRLFILVLKCIEHREPVLLVGDTGCGKTTVCQVLAAMLGKELHIVNAHQHSETADFLGSQRPVRGKDLTEVELRQELAEFSRQYGDVHMEMDEEMDGMDLANVVSRVEATAKALLSQSHPSSTDVDARRRRIQSLYIRSRALFEWHDGPLVKAMRQGDAFLLDEISLADDSVLERLNSVLEPQQLLVLAEKGGSEVEELYGADGFRFLATMNPGGDYGKKELSPALRNRFTEIWAPPVSDRDDSILIIEKKLHSGNAAGPGWASKMLEFLDWFAGQLRKPRETIMSLRDVLAWVEFVVIAGGKLGVAEAFVHGGCMVFVDGIGVNPLFGMVTAAEQLRRECRLKLRVIAAVATAGDEGDEFESDGASTAIASATEIFGVKPFLIQKGPQPARQVQFAMQAPTTLRNCMRVLRALQLHKPVLLEGSPGVGKTSLISSLAAAAGYDLVRINLSEQTDLMDLFGSDLPVEGGSGGEFAWRDGPFLKAMQEGSWVLLDELNLASQQVLEGLNACLDHRAAVYVPELDRAFGCHPAFRVIAAQNPQHQGGGRKGLPRSFVNRFTQVYVEALTEADLLFISRTLHPDVDADLLARMIRFNERMKEETMEKCTFGWKGGPWEFNLRDVMRWVELLKSVGKGTGDPGDYLEMVYSQRMRTPEDADQVRSLYANIFGQVPETSSRRPFWHISEQMLQIGNSFMERKSHRGSVKHAVPVDHLQILPSSLQVMESLLKCVEMKWMALLTGPAASGKTSLVRLLAAVMGERLEEFSMNPGVDAVELLGGFEQVDLKRRERSATDAIGRILDAVVRKLIASDRPEAVAGSKELQCRWEAVQLEAESTGVLNVSVVQDLFARLDTLMYDLSISEGVPTLQSARHLLDVYQTTLTQGVYGRFEWIDGTLIKALEEGHWILIDNVNLCPASVLDRLNSLLEPNGALMVNERGLVNGQVKVIRPHSNFRIFMTMDPRFGEISRAMRNRAVELSVSPDKDTPGVVDVVRLLNDVGLPGAQIPRAIYNMHVANKNADVNVPNEPLDGRAIVQFGRILVNKLQRGEDWDAAVRQTAQSMESEDCADSGREDRFSQNLLEDLVAQGSNLFEGADRNNCLSFPTSWPHRLSGQVVAEVSEMANVAVQGAYFATAVRSSGPVFSLSRGALDLKPVPSRERVLDAAARLFLSYGEPVDRWHRESWWACVIQSALLAGDTEGLRATQLVEHLSSIESRTAVEEVLEARLEVAALSGIPSELLKAQWPQPLDLRMNPSLSMRLQRVRRTDFGTAWANYMRALSLYSVHRRLAEAKFIEELAYTAGQDVRVSDMTIAQQSQAYGTGRIGHSQLVHPVVRVLKNPSLIVEVLAQRNCLWFALQLSRIHLDEIVIGIRRLSKALAKCEPYVSVDSGNTMDEDTAKLSSLMREAGDLLHLRELEATSLLWKNGGIVMLRSQELAATETRFYDANKMLRLWDEVSLGKCLDHPFLFADSLMKQSLVDGVATLYYLNEQGVDGRNQLLDLIRDVPQRIEEKLQQFSKEALEERESIAQSQVVMTSSLVPLPVRVPLQFAVDRGARAARLALWSVLDIANVTQEMGILQKLLAIAGGRATDNAVKVPLAEMVPQLKSFLEDSFAKTSRAPLDLEPLQRLIWLCDTSEGSNNLPVGSAMLFLRVVLQDAVYRWHRTMWKNGSSIWANLVDDDKALGVLNGAIVPVLAGDAESQDFAGSVLGPALLHSGVKTLLTLHLLHPLERVPIYAVSNKIHQLMMVKEHVLSPQVDVGIIGIEDCLMIMSAVQQFVQSHAKVFEHGAHAAITAVLDRITCAIRQNSEPLVSDALSEIATNLSGAHSPIVKSRFEDFIIPAVSAVLQMQHLGDYSPQLRGKAWINVSLAFLRSYIPQMPVDPAAAPAIKLAFLEESSAALRAGVLVNSEMEYLTTGNDENDVVKAMLARLKSHEEKRRKWGPRMALRPDRSQIHDIFNDLKRLGGNILSDSAVSSLVSDLSTGANSSEAVVAKENFLQETLVSVIERFEAQYPMYRDILQPVSLAVYQFKYGLRLMAHSRPKSQSEPVEDAVKQLIRIVDDGPEDAVLVEHLLGSIKNVLSSLDHTQAVRLRIHTALAFLKRFEAINRARSPSASIILPVFHVLASDIVSAWSEAEADRLEKEAEEAERYKYKERKHEIDSEDVMDEADFRERFPDFELEFADVLRKPEDSHVDAQPKLGKKEIKDETALLASVAQDIRLVHDSVAQSLITPDKASVGHFDQDWAFAFQGSYNVATDIARILKTAPSHTLDSSSRAANLYMSEARLKALRDANPSEDGAPGNPKIGYDFYKDANIPEARRILPILLNLDRRLTALLKQWPEHTVLLQLATICGRIAAFPITSPVMKLLTGLEMLLQKAQDWEAYAGREVSLKAHMDEITVCIVAWRKLELRSWKELLNVEDRRSEEKASALWFHLWQIVVGVATANSSDNVEDEEAADAPLLKGLLEALDQLCLTSTLGQFLTRLRMIQTFHSYVSAMAPEVPQNRRPRLESLASVLFNVHKYYSQFADEVKNTIEMRRKPISKELNDYVQIASWKDVNVYALKESATRTHYQLHKHVKKYRMVLDHPVKDAITAYHDKTVMVDDKAAKGVAPILERVKSGSPEKSVSSLSSVVQPLPLADTANLPYIGNITRYTRQMQNLSRAAFSDLQSPVASYAIDEIACTVLERIKEFREQNASLVAGSKVAKGQRAIRKKALVDLLKYLARLGLSPRCAHLYNKQQDLSNIFTSSPPYMDTALRAGGRSKGWLIEDITALWAKADQYFYRVLARMSKLRTLALSVSQDLTGGEAEKGVSYLEHLLHLSIEQRHVLARFCRTYSPLMKIAGQIGSLHSEMVSGSGNPVEGRAVLPGSDVVSAFIEVKNALDCGIVVLSQASMVAAAGGGEMPDLGEASDVLQELRAELMLRRTTWDGQAEKLTSKDVPPVVSESVQMLFREACECVERIHETLSATHQKFPALSYVFEDVLDVFSRRAASVRVAIERLSRNTEAADVGEGNVIPALVDDIIKSLLVSFQELRRETTATSTSPETDDDEDEFGLKPRHLLQAHQKFTHLFGSIHVDALMGALRRLMTSAGIFSDEHQRSSAERRWVAHALACVHPLLHQYLLSLQHRLFEFVLHHRSSLKLTFVLANTFSELFKNGFCVPQNEKEQDEEEGGTEENVAGTGIGEGEGEKDVSDEIEDQEQVEGMQNDESNDNPDPQKPIKDEKNGVEMDQDFDGKLEDVDDDGREDDDESGEEQEGQEEPEEQMGDVDGNANVVDEKLWGDEDETKDGEEKTERDAPVEEGGGEVETVAKEDRKEDEQKGQADEKKPKENTKEEKDEKHLPDGDDSDNDGDEEGDETVNEDDADKYEDNHGLDVKQADNAEQQNPQDEDQEDFDLPEEMDLDGEEQGDDKGGADEGGGEMDIDQPKDSEISKEKAEQADGSDEDDDEAQGADEGEGLDQDVDEEDAEMPPAEGLVEQEEEAGDEKNREEEGEMGEDENTAPAHGFGEEEKSGEPEDHIEEESIDTVQPVDDQNTSTTQPFGVQGEVGEKSNTQRQEPSSATQETSETAGQETAEDMNASSRGTPQTRPQDDKEASKRQPKERNQDLNPRRSLGDALKKWMKRLEAISDRPETDESSSELGRDEDQELGSGDRRMEYEFVQEDTEAADAQALDVATAEQMTEMDRKALADDTEEKEYGDDDVDQMDLDEEEPVESKQEDQNMAKSRNLDRPNGSLDIGKKDSEDRDLEKLEKEGEGDLAAREEQEIGSDAEYDDVTEERGAREDAEVPTDDEMPELLSAEGYEELRRNLEQSVASWRESGQDPREAQELWRTYVTLTRDLSFELCEQLRLILEPTLATKLKGDYRTGKRLNMRKVIPYIASQFKKDKIWLRRTKPSKRTYQIMIAIDDSRSMAESRSVQLAYESLALITKALSQLEAGDVSVVSFGEQVQLLHPFERPFSDEAGADVIRRFTFTQDRTHVLHMMESTMGILEHARASTSSTGSGDLWQLQLVISDGICEDHDRVRAVVRRAAEMRIMVVFLVLDGGKTKRDSISQMTNVTYGTDPITGKATLQMRKYMDTFPFDYYVLVKDVGTLPEVLSDTLRQYFMFVGG
ncbi:AAA ATPase midasin [Borealophlyctis nickersoniae]|nr:AAA ATPase midasin [Borealophlyctis nickersoniae]